MKKLFLLPFIILFAACKPTPRCETSAPSGKLQVLATFLPIHAHAAAIAGDRAVVESLIAGNIGPHDFSPCPRDMQRIAQADVFVLNGAGMEPWLDDLIQQAAKKNLRKVDLSSGIELLTNQQALDGEPHHHASEPNPHLWLDPVIAIQQVETLRDALIAADPDGSAIYQQNTANYIAKLLVLDADYQRILGPLPFKKLITFHDAFPYLAKRYGLETIGYLSQFPERDPSPAGLAALINSIREKQVKVLFAEASYESALLRRIATDTGARFSMLDTLEVGALGPEAYLTGMRKNLEALRVAFTP